MKRRSVEDFGDFLDSVKEVCSVNTTKIFHLSNQSVLEDLINDKERQDLVLVTKLILKHFAEYDDYDQVAILLHVAKMDEIVQKEIDGLEIENTKQLMQIRTTVTRAVIWFFTTLLLFFIIYFTLNFDYNVDDILDTFSDIKDTTNILLGF